MAGYISKETIEEIQQKADIVSIISEYTKLEKRGTDYWGCCPFHHEKTPSFHVEPDKRFFYCFSCHAGGNVIKFLMEVEKISYTEAITSLAKKTGTEIIYSGNGQNFSTIEDKNAKKIDELKDLYDRTASMFHYFLLETEQGKSAYKYIKERGLSDETIEKFKLGYAPKDLHWLKKFLLSKNFTEDFLKTSGLFSSKYPDISFFSNRLMFPIFDRYGKVVAMGGRKLDENPKTPKYLNSGEMLQYKKGETLYAFNFAKKAIKENKKVIFCEGYMDCIAYHQCGIEYAVAPLGTALTEEQIKIIQPFCDEVLLSFDSDGAGQKATERAIYMLRRNNITVKIIKLSGGKDPAEIMLNLGKKILTTEVSCAILDIDFLLSKLGAEYSVNTPEGKTKAALAFFPYIDSLQSDIQKESSLEQLCQTFNLKPEAVKRDFENREKAAERITFRQPDVNKPQMSIKLNAELRGLLAIIANLDKYKTIRSELSDVVFEDSSARKLYEILECCFQEESLSLVSILNHCDDSRLSNIITKVISLGEFKDNSENAILDSIKLLKRKCFERKRDDLQNQIKTFKVVTQDDQIQFNKLIQEKIELDRMLIH